MSGARFQSARARTAVEAEEASARSGAAPPLPPPLAPRPSPVVWWPEASHGRFNNPRTMPAGTLNYYTTTVLLAPLYHFVLFVPVALGPVALRFRAGNRDTASLFFFFWVGLRLFGVHWLCQMEMGLVVRFGTEHLLRLVTIRALTAFPLTRRGGER